MTKNRKFFFMVFLLTTVLWGPMSFGQLSGLRSRSVDNPLNSISDMRTFRGSGVDALNDYGASAYQNRSQSYNNVLNSSNNLGGTRRGRTSGGLNYGNIGLTPSYSSSLGSSGFTFSRQPFPGYKNGGASSALGGDMRTMPSITGPEQVMMPLMNDLDPIILLPSESAIENAYKKEWEISAQQAVKPFVEKSLLKPTLAEEKLEDAELAENQDPFRKVSIKTENLGLTTGQGEIYTAQQISLARNYVRDRKFDQALNCYQAARSVDQKNTNALIGIALCHIMTGKLQAGGLNVKFLAQQDPDFWQKTPDFMAIFGVSASDIRQSIAHVEPEVDQYLSRYHASDSKATAENLKLANLAKMFLAWLKDNQAGMQAGIQAAADAGPLDAPVQKLCRSIVGCNGRNELKLEPIKPMD